MRPFMYRKLDNVYFQNLINNQKDINDTKYY